MIGGHQVAAASLGSTIPARSQREERRLRRARRQSADDITNTRRIDASTSRSIAPIRAEWSRWCGKGARARLCVTLVLCSGSAAYGRRTRGRADRTGRQGTRTGHLLRQLRCERSPLRQITRDNAKSLVPVWALSAGFPTIPSPGGLEAAPLVVDGVLPRGHAEQRVCCRGRHGAALVNHLSWPEKAVGRLGVRGTPPTKAAFTWGRRMPACCAGRQDREQVWNAP